VNAICSVKTKMENAFNYYLERSPNWLKEILLNNSNVILHTYDITPIVDIIYTQMLYTYSDDLHGRHFVPHRCTPNTCNFIAHGEQSMNATNDEIRLARFCLEMDHILENIEMIKTGVVNPVANNNQCVICMAAAATWACVPCGHQCCCVSCMNNLRQGLMECPICRAQMTTAIRIYTV
jgi:hypothetical protein